MFPRVTISNLLTRGIVRGIAKRGIVKSELNQLKVILEDY